MDDIGPSPGVVTLRAMQPPITIVPAGTKLARIWFAGSSFPTGAAHFRTFGPTDARFDHHLGDGKGGPTNGGRGILYAVEADHDPDAFACALGEIFQTARQIDTRTGEPRLAVLTTQAPLSLIDLSGFGATRIGGSTAFSSGRRDTCRAWSRDIYGAYPDCHGIRYRSSMSGEQTIAVAIYERAGFAMPSKADSDLSLDHPAMRHSVVKASKLLGYSVVSS